jgi:hypothetical protein
MVNQSDRLHIISLMDSVQLGEYERAVCISNLCKDDKQELLDAIDVALINIARKWNVFVVNGDIDDIA